MTKHARLVLLSVALLGLPASSSAAEPLHEAIDRLVLAKAKGVQPSSVADDAEFLRRLYLDLAGRIPSVSEVRAFLADKTSDKRARLIQRLLNGPEYPRRMQEMFHVMLMERLGDNADWTKYLQDSFRTNKPWDQMAREILRAAPNEPATKGSAFFIAKRLESYGANPVDYAGLTRDVGRLFLGKDFRCAQCHNHLFIDDYMQRDFQGLLAFVQNAYLQDAKNLVVAEKPTLTKITFMSVFNSKKKETGPRVPGLKEVAIPAIPKGQEYLQPSKGKKGTLGVLRFSPLAKLAENLPTAADAAFTRNSANRLWYVMMGRGLVHPLDLHHGANPPAHPDVLDLVAREFVAHKFDINWLLGELALTQTYQRSSILPSGKDNLPPESFLTAIEKRMSAEQLLASILEAAGEKERVTAAKKPGIVAVRTLFLRAFANPRREPEGEFSPSLKAALFVLNDATILDWLKPRPGNLVDRLNKISDPGQVAEELYLTVLTRMPTAEERAMVANYLAKKADRRAVALGHLAWALLASTEFCVNH